MSWNKNHFYSMNAAGDQLEEVAKMIHWTMGDPSFPPLTPNTDFTITKFVSDGIGLPPIPDINAAIDVTFNKDCPGKVKSGDTRTLYYRRRSFTDDLGKSEVGLIIALSGKPTTEEVLTWVEKYFVGINPAYTKSTLRLGGSSTGESMSYYLVTSDNSYLHSGAVTVTVGKPDLKYIVPVFEAFTAD